MAFQQRDLKILWGRAAGRCSMPDCRKHLVTDASDAVPSKAILLGENCHIVGESVDGPRGKSDLSTDERNRYPNLILLCGTHHSHIDQDPGSWSIERLHQIKADHEVWVETQLTQGESVDAQYYARMVNQITERLHLASWDWISDNAFRLILMRDFVDGVNAVSEMTARATWPDGQLKLRKTIVNLADRLSTYVSHFMSRARLVESEPAHYREDKSWKTGSATPESFQKTSEAAVSWQRTSLDLLGNVVVALNEFAETVRKTINPRYMLYQGKFTVIDSLGLSTDMHSSFYIPTKYAQAPRRR